MNSTCRDCGSLTDRSHQFCAFCGSELRFETVCSACGTLIEDDFRLCFECGASRTDAATNTEATPDVQRVSIQTKFRNQLSSISIARKTRSLIVEAQSQTSLWHFDEFENLPARKRLTIEVAAVAVLSVLALYLRIYDLATLPLGFELNESELSIDALRVLNGEWIGV